MYRSATAVILTAMISGCFEHSLRANSITGIVWEKAGDTANADDFFGNTTGPSAMFTSTGINYCSQGGAGFFQGGCGFGPGGNGTAYQVSAFLHNPAFSNETAGFDPALSLSNTFIQLSGTIALHAGANDFVLVQDDGINLTIAGIGTVLNSPIQTNQVDHFTITAPFTGNFGFTLDYAENANPPAALQWTYASGRVVGAIPEPGSLVLLATGFGAISLLLRRRRRGYLRAVR